MSEVIGMISVAVWSACATLQFCTWNMGEGKWHLYLCIVSVFLAIACGLTSLSQ